jgi:SAM-dependent methyltransferase
MKNTEITRATYERIALTYAQVSATMSAALLTSASDQTRTFWMLVADPDVAWFESQNINVIGVDFSGSMLEIARSRVRGSLVQADMRKMPFEAHSMDGIWCNASLLHLPKTDSPAALLEFKRILKPNGILFLAVQEGEGEHLETREVYGENQRFFARYTTSEMTRMLEVAGFDLLENHEHESRDRVWIRFLARVKIAD